MQSWGKVVSDTHSGDVATGKRHHRDLMRRTLLHLISIYLLPILLLTFYFHFQSLSLREEGRHNHLQSIAEYQARMLDLFIRERAVNLSNLIDNPNLEIFPSRSILRSYLEDLQRDSDTFVDIGVFNSNGDQVVYAGPFPVLEERNYFSEQWFEDLQSQEKNFVITDIYLGFRKRPHFTIAVSRIINGRFIAMRATLDPDKMYNFFTFLEGVREMLTSIVNRDGVYQVVTPNVGTLLAESSIVPPQVPKVGVQQIEINDRRIVYGYTWLVEADWALIAQGAEDLPNRLFLGGDYKIAGVAIIIFVLIFMATLFRAQRLVKIEEERDLTKLQLEHSAKLASVGELAGGIAHEINNPLAIINEEAGLMKDLMSPEFGKQITHDDITSRLEIIQEAVFRCRDITRKLLGFVRKTEFRLAQHDIPNLIDEVVNDFFVHEMELSKIEIRREYEDDLPAIITDSNQLKQVCINIINNAADAIDGSGEIRIVIKRKADTIQIAFRDTGCGMTDEQIQNIFMPFYTTKEVGKGTGLGLSVSYGIIEGIGGSIDVQSEPGQGSTFTIVLPIR